jgi:hypothetical protein
VAVVLISQVTKRFIGLAADPKPTDALQPAGSTFYEADTRNNYIYDGSAWQPAAAAVDPNGNLEVTAANSNWVNPLTIPAGAVYGIASGNEVIVGDLTVNGTMINAGYLRCKSVTSGLGSTFIAELGSTKEIFAGY